MNGSDIPDDFTPTVSPMFSVADPSYERRRVLRPSHPDTSANLVEWALRGTLKTQPTARNVRDLLLCMSADTLRLLMVEDGFCEHVASDHEVFLKYLSGQGSRRYSPNTSFDEIWYLSAYPDVREAILRGDMPFGFVHFVLCGIHEGRWPNPALHRLSAASKPHAPVEHIDEPSYLAANTEARVFLGHFPILDVLDYYNLYGRYLGPAVEAPPMTGYQTIVQQDFDHAFYSERYLGGQQAGNAFRHYIESGVKHGHSPNTWFDEAWYRAFYADVRDAIAEGWVTCGYQHYLCSGRSEKRLPNFDLAKALEARLPGVTQPALLDRIPDLESRMLPPVFTVDADAPARVWFILPWINPDIAFGGHIAAMELLLALHRAHYLVGIVCADDAHADKEYFLWREKRPRFRDLIRSIPLVNLRKAGALCIGPHDTFVVYSVWNLQLGACLAAATSRRRPMLLAQEFEAAFYSNSSIRLMCERAYDLDHYPIVNSAFLLAYLRTHGIGVFGRGREPVPFRDYAVFEHRVAPLPRQSAATMAERRTRLLVAYARPEAHAERNLFEVVVLALRQAIREGLFGPEWAFIGVGALSELEPVPLGDGRCLGLSQKMTEAEYHAHVQAMDIGISLMYAPHPSVVPFEFATSGAIVVTNTYENRSAAELRAICANIVPATPSVQGVVDAFRTALGRVEDFTARERDAYAPPATRWDQSFPESFVQAVFGATPVADKDPGEARPPSARPPLASVLPPRSRPKRTPAAEKRRAP